MSGRSSEKKKVTAYWWTRDKILMDCTIGQKWKMYIQICGVFLVWDGSEIFQPSS